MKQKKKTRAGTSPAKPVTAAPLKERTARTSAPVNGSETHLSRFPEHWTATIRAHDLIAEGISALRELPPEVEINLASANSIADQMEEFLLDLAIEVGGILFRRRMDRQKIDPPAPADFVNGTPRFTELTSTLRIPEKVEALFEAMAHLELAAKTIEGLSPDVKIGDFTSETLADGLRGTDEYVELENAVRRLFLNSLSHSVDGYTGRSGDAA